MLTSRKNKKHSIEMEGKKADDRLTQYVLAGAPTECLKLFSKGCEEVKQAGKKFEMSSRNNVKRVGNSTT